jgi:hypothetical protein
MATVTKDDNNLKYITSLEDRGRHFVRLDYLGFKVVVCNDKYFRLLNFERPNGGYIEEYSIALRTAMQDTDAKYVNKTQVEIQNVPVHLFDYNGIYEHIDYILYISNRLNKVYYQFESMIHKLVEAYRKNYENGRLINKSLLDSDKQAEKQIDVKADKQADVKVEKQAEKQIDVKVEKRAEKQIDVKVEKQAEKQADIPYSAIIYESAIQQLSKSVMDERHRNDELTEELKKANMQIVVLVDALKASNLKIDRVKDALA